MGSSSEFGPTAQSNAVEPVSHVEANNIGWGVNQVMRAAVISGMSWQTAVSELFQLIKPQIGKQWDALATIPVIRGPNEEKGTLLPADYGYRQNPETILLLRVLDIPGIPLIGPGKQVGEISKPENIFGANIILALLREYSQAKIEVARLPDLTQGMDILLVAGHQLSGKDTAAGLLSQDGYRSLSFGSIVQNVTSALGLDRNDTQVKIDVGKWMKEKFGLDILVPMALLEAGINRNKKVILTGPRKMEEVDKAIKCGAKLIGIVADSDPEIDREIRRGRADKRARSDPRRAMDIEKFNEREEQEWTIIQEILDRGDCRLVVNNSEEAELAELMKDLI